MKLRVPWLVGVAVTSAAVAVAPLSAAHAVRSPEPGLAAPPQPVVEEHGLTPIQAAEWMLAGAALLVALALLAMSSTTLRLWLADRLGRRDGELMAAGVHEADVGHHPEHGQDDVISH